MVLSVNEYVFSQVVENLYENFDTVFGVLRDAGVGAYEPSLFLHGDTDPLRSALARHRITTPSAYVNARLHEPNWAEQVEAFLRTVDRYTDFGIQIAVTNPEPIRWGGPEEKTDEELGRQSQALALIGQGLAERGITLAYHVHDPELRSNGREFHGMLGAVGADTMKYCHDLHWVYRGSGNDHAALDAATLQYGPRTVELHVRQSQGGVWSEFLGEGDIDYPDQVAKLKAAGFDGVVCLEQAVEDGTPRTLTIEERIRRDADWARATFGID